jgi:hypothetical protein
LLVVKPPIRYDYNQSLEQDKYTRTRDGKRLQVRRRGADGNYIVLPAGEDFFRYHSSFWTPIFPRVIIKPRKAGDGYVAVRSKSGTDYVPLAGLPQLTSATLRQLAGDKEKPVFADDDEQRAEAIEAARAHLATLDKMVVDGKTYSILYY